jgi:hypothetical protein
MCFKGGVFFKIKALLNLVVDFRCRRSLSAGGPGASSVLCTCGVSLGLALPQESHVSVPINKVLKSTVSFNRAKIKKRI